MLTNLSKKFILVTTLVSLVFNQAAFAAPQAQGQPSAVSSAPIEFSGEESVRAIARIAPNSSIEKEVDAAISKSDRSSRTFLKNAGVGLLQGIVSLMVLTLADQIRTKLHENHLQMDKRILPQLGEEAVKTMTAQQQVLYKSIDSALSQPALLASGAILSALIKPVVNHLINQRNFQTFLASAAVGVILSYGIEGVTEMMKFSVRSVYEDPSTQFKLTPKQVTLMKFLIAPDNYSTSYMLAGIWSEDKDRQVVSNLIFKKVLSRFWNDQGFRRAFYSSWMRNQLTGSTAVKLGSLLLTRWAYVQLTTALVAATGAVAGTVVEPGGGTAVGGTLGLGTGFLLGLGISTVVGLGLGSVSDYEKDALTYYIRQGYLRAASLKTAAITSVAQQWILHTEDNQENAEILNTYVDFESMRKNRERMVINQLDLVKTAVTRLDALQLDLFYTQVQHAALKQKGTWEYVKKELITELRSFPRTMLLMPGEPLLIEGIRKDQKMIEVYRSAFEECSLKVLSTYDKDVAHLRIIANSTEDEGVKLTATREIKELIQFRKFYSTLFNWLKSGINTWIISPDYLAARQTVDRLTFWNWQEADLKTRLSIH